MNSNFKTNIPELDNIISALAKGYFDIEKAEIIRQMFTAVAKFGLESSNRGDMKLLNSNIKELRYAFHVFSEFRKVRKVVIFGSARTKKDQAEYKMAEEFARKISQKGFMIITGAGSGIMEAGNKGAGKGKSFGVNIMLPYEQKANKFILEKHQINFKYFFTRKLIFLKESDATVLFPGGFGTFDEGMEVLTLIQTGKTRPRPIIFIEPEGSNFWGLFHDFIRNKLLKHQYISNEDISLFKVVNNIDKAVEEIENFYAIYHSTRFVKEKTVLRLTQPVSENIVKKLNENFKDLLIKGSITTGPPQEDEIKNNEFVELPRLIMLFNRKNYGRLVDLIRFLNKNIE